MRLCTHQWRGGAEAQQHPCQHPKGAAPGRQPGLAGQGSASSRGVGSGAGGSKEARKPGRLTPQSVPQQHRRHAVPAVGLPPQTRHGAYPAQEAAPSSPREHVAHVRSCLPARAPQARRLWTIRWVTGAGARRGGGSHCGHHLSCCSQLPRRHHPAQSRSPQGPPARALLAWPAGRQGSRLDRQQQRGTPAASLLPPPNAPSVLSHTWCRASLMSLRSTSVHCSCSAVSRAGAMSATLCAPRFDKLAQPQLRRPQWRRARLRAKLSRSCVDRNSKEDGLLSCVSSESN